MTISRREFSKTTAASVLGVSAYLGFPSLLRAFSNKSRVVLIRSQKLERVDHMVTKEAVVPFLDKAMMKITDHLSPPKAWRALFSPGERVGIKLSCLPGKPLSSGYGVVMAIVDGLRSCGIRDKDIFIWERSDRELKRAGFQISRSGVHVTGTDSFTGYGDGYSDDIEFAGSMGTRFSKIMERVDAVINVPVLKDHDLSGVSISLKNHYGSIYNPNKFHRNNCNPYIAELNRHPIIGKKQRLIVCDATRVQVNNGPAFYPSYAWEFGGLLVSRDPVALDYVGWQIIEERRKELKLKTLKAVDREPKYIHTASKLKLGNIDERHIERIVIQ